MCVTEREDRRRRRGVGGGELGEEGASDGGEGKGSSPETRNTEQGPREPMGSNKSYWIEAERE